MKHRGAAALVHVTMQGATGITVPVKRLPQIGHIGLAVAEDDRVLEIVGAVDQFAKDGALLVVFHWRSYCALGDGLGCRRRCGHRNGNRILQKLRGEFLDFGWHGGGEEQGLPREWHHFHYPLDIGDETHVEHAVCFVDDKDFNACHQQFAALEMVEQAAWCGDQHINSAVELAKLVFKRDTADQQCNREFVVDAVAVEAFLNLCCKFAGWLQDQRAWHSCPCAALFEARKHGKYEGGCLASTSLGNSKHIAACQNMGDRLFLNGGRLGVAA